MPSVSSNNYTSSRGGLGITRKETNNTVTTEDMGEIDDEDPITENGETDVAVEESNEDGVSD